MDIQFKQPDGRTFQATLVDDRLTDIRELTGGAPQPSPSPSPAPTSGSGESDDKQPQSSPSKPLKPLGKADEVFVEQLKAVLVNNRARKQLRHKQKGLLDPRAFVKTQSDVSSVFRQNNRKDSQRNYSVVLLVDESGSMHDGKSDLAQEVVASISTSLDRVDGVECAVLGFSGDRIVEHKRFDNTGRNTVNTIADLGSDDQIDRVQSSDHENADLMAMDYAVHYLKENASRNSKLVFIMLSDGEPCSSDSSITVVTADMQGKQYRSKMIATLPDGVRSNEIAPMHAIIRRNPDVNSFGLGMLRGGQQVPNHKVVKDIKQTKVELLRFLREAIA